MSAQLFELVAKRVLKDTARKNINSKVRLARKVFLINLC